MMRAKKNISKIVLNINLAEDKGLFEPYVFNDTRAVLRRVQGSNPLFLSDICIGDYTLLPFIQIGNKYFRHTYI